MQNSSDLRIGELILGNRPALVIVDMSLGFTSPDSPLGGDFESVIKANAELLKLFREKHWPVFFTTVVYEDDTTASVFRQRLPDLNILKRNSHWIDITPQLKPLATESIVEKHWPSGFFATHLEMLLKQQKADCLVVTGLTTSGCVRATITDGLQYNYPVFVPEDACGDRNLNAHQASLHDLNAKYASVITSTRLIAALQTIPV
ncbi:MAG: maleamate amidohydrolase [Paraglaciecola sp.]|jgi:maleamate amidohydrolase